MSGSAFSVGSSFLTPNELMTARYGNQRAADIHQNDLLTQRANEQAIGGADTEMAARIARTLVATGDEAKAAQLYPGMIAEAQGRGFLKNAPLVFPGMEHARRVMDLGTSSEKLGERQANQAGWDQITGGGGPAMAPAPPGAYGQGGKGSSITVPPEYMPFYQEASQRTGIPVEVLIAQHRQESGFNPNATGAAGEIGIGQIHPNTAANPGYGMTGVDPARLRDPRTNINFAADYLKARGGGGNWADPEHQRRALAAYNGGGDPNYVTNVTRYLPAGYSGASAPRTATAAPAAPGQSQQAQTGPAPLVFGDSLAVGIGKAGGYKTTAQEGANPRAVLASIMATPAEQIVGRDVVLSGGASNAPGDVGFVADQVRALKAKGARNVTIVGVGDRKDLADNGVNASLQNAAQQTGAVFQPLDPATLSADRVHPGNYNALVPRGGPQAPTGGVAARTGGTDVAGPGAGPSAPQGATQGGGGGMLAGLTPEQQTVVRGMRAAGIPFATAMTQIQHFKEQNAAAAHQTEQDQRQRENDAKAFRQEQANIEQRRIANEHQAAQLQLSRESGQRAVEEAAQKAKEAGRPLQGNDVTIQHERILNELTPKIRDGTATEEEQRLYAGSYYALQQSGGQATTMTDPNNTGSQIPAMITRRLPPSFPEPQGGALPLVMSAPGAAKKEAMTEGQGNAAAFADRMTLASPLMERLDETAVTWAQGIKEKAGNFLGYNLTSPDYQKLRTAQEAFLAGVLRKESGAAVNPDEWKRYAHLYFPMPGEDTETIKLKRQFRQATLEGMIREAGPNYKPSAATAGTTKPGERPPLTSFQK